MLEDYLTSRGLQFGRIDGSITGAKRQASIDEYNREGSPLFIMVIPLGFVIPTYTNFIDYQRRIYQEMVS